MRKVEMTKWDEEQLEMVRGKKVYANIVSVSASGMSRKMKFYITVDGEIRNVTYYIAGALKYNLTNDDCIRVGGCGMDMAFSVLSDLNYTMARQDTGETIQELMESKECGERIYDKYFVDADNYGRIYNEKKI